VNFAANVHQKMHKITSKSAQYKYEVYHDSMKPNLHVDGQTCRWTSSWTPPPRHPRWSAPLPYLLVLNRALNTSAPLSPSGLPPQASAASSQYSVPQERSASSVPTPPENRAKKRSTFSLTAGDISGGSTHTTLQRCFSSCHYAPDASVCSARSGLYGNKLLHHTAVCRGTVT